MRIVFRCPLLVRSRRSPLLSAVFFCATNFCAVFFFCAAFFCAGFFGVAFFCAPLAASARVRPLADAKPAMLVHIVDYASVSSDELRGATTEATRLWSQIEVPLAWTTGEQEVPHSPALDVTVILLRQDMAQRMIVSEHRGDGVLGRAVPEALRAYIFYDRVKNTSARYGSARGVLLGDVVAHELGHLLLGHSHSPDGLMKAQPDFFSKRLSFSNADGARIRAGILGKLKANN